MASKDAAAAAAPAEAVDVDADEEAPEEEQKGQQGKASRDMSRVADMNDDGGEIDSQVVTKVRACGALGPARRVATRADLLGWVGCCGHPRPVADGHRRRHEAAQREKGQAVRGVRALRGF